MASKDMKAYMAGAAIGALGMLGAVAGVYLMQQPARKCGGGQHCKVINLHDNKHPLDPPTVEEMEEAAKLLLKKFCPQKFGTTNPAVRIIRLSLLEPKKTDMLAYKEGDAYDRRIRCIFLRLEAGTSTGHMAVINITKGTLESWTAHKGMQAAVVGSESDMIEKVMLKHPDVITAMARRGLTDPSKWMIEPWSAGYAGVPEEEGKRLLRCLVWTRMDDNEDNGYAHPVEGMVVVCNLDTMKVVRVEDVSDEKLLQVEKTPGNYAAKFIKNMRPVPKPYLVTQPEGVNFKIEGHQITWDIWRFRVGWELRSGLVIHMVEIKDGEKYRPVFHRLSLAEMIVPYGSPAKNHNRKCAFDVGEYGIGELANSLELGCDCKGSIAYLDSVIAGGDGKTRVVKNTICIHEEDAGMAWKHLDHRLGKPEVRRGSKLVVSFIATVGNYEYAFYWNFMQDGTIEPEIKMTGLLNTSGIGENEESVYGVKLQKGLEAQNHQHIFSFRIDPVVDGVNNKVVQVDSIKVKSGPQNPMGNAYYAKETVLRTEKTGHSDLDTSTCRYWKFVNDSKLNRMGKPVAWRLLPRDNGAHMLNNDAWVLKRAPWVKHHLWTTKYHEDELYPSGMFANQSNGSDTLETWIKRDDNIENTDVVVWYTLVANHIPRLEDWPCMPTHTLSFMLQPCNFFGDSPAITLAPEDDKHSQRLQ